MKNLILLIILIGSINSCKSVKQNEITGIYFARKKANFLDYVLLKYRNLNDTIVIYPNHTYKHIACTIDMGKWEIKNNKIYFKRDSIRYRIDTLNNPTNISTLKNLDSTRYYIIKKNRLIYRKDIRHISEYIKKDY